MSSLFEKRKVVVVGDLMLDVYTMGVVKRISPEAPVAILRVDEESERPGGSGNAMLNLCSLGMEVIAIGRIGDDLYGRHLKGILFEEGVDTQGIVTQEGFQTPVKKRMIADNQQLLRVDYENPQPLDSALEKELIAQLPEILEGASVVAISDYAKGFLTSSFLASLIEMANERSIPTIVDPKDLDFTKYQGATLIKPNQNEAYGASRLVLSEPLNNVAAKLLKETAIETLMVTRSKEGISLFSRTAPQQDFPVSHVHEVKDVTGAGDTVLAVISAALANQMTLEKGVRLANLAAGMAIERLGCARISLAELERAFQISSQVEMLR